MTLQNAPMAQVIVKAFETFATLKRMTKTTLVTSGLSLPT